MGLSGSLLLLTAVLPGQPSPSDLYQDFRGRQAPAPFLEMIGPNSGQVIHPEEEGLRITLPTNGQQTWGWGVGARCRLAGDFEVTGTYQVLSIERPVRGSGAVIALQVAPDTDRDKWARIGHVVHLNGSTAYQTEVWTKKQSPQDYKARAVPTQASGGRLRLVRQGTILRCQAAEGAEEDFLDVYEGEFGTDDLTIVRFVANNNSSPTSVDVRLVDLKIHCEGMKRQEVVAPPPRRMPRGLFLVLAFFLVLLAVGLWFYLRRRTEKVRPATPPTPTVPHTPGSQALLVARPRSSAAGGRVRRFPLTTGLLLSGAIVGGAFLSGLRANQTGEYFHIARALADGEGFANAIGAPTGATAWMPPVLPSLLAGLLWAGDGDRQFVAVVLVTLHVCTLIGTGFLVLALAGLTTRHVPAGVVATIFFLGILNHFTLCFQRANEPWLILLMVDLLVAGFCWWRPLQTRPRAAGWGVFGGLCALTNPIVGFAWGMVSLGIGVWRGTRGRLSLALLCAALTLTPWTARNYLVFGRFIPVKSNLAYELYQSQCLQPDGLLEETTIRFHPTHTESPRERWEFQQLGETAYLDKKWDQFTEAVRKDPADLVARLATRLLGATIWYVPFNRTKEAEQPWLLGVRELVHPLPFLALAILLVSTLLEPLLRTQWVVMGIYILYLLPYIVVSYYDRYAVPLVGVKVLLVIWAAERMLSFVCGYLLDNEPARPEVEEIELAELVPEPITHSIAVPGASDPDLQRDLPASHLAGVEYDRNLPPLLAALHRGE
jgi:hypothetical protein